MNRLYNAIAKKLDGIYETDIVGVDKLKKQAIKKERMKADTVGIVGIFLYPSSNDEEDLGGLVYESIKAHIQLNVTPGIDMIKGMNFLRSFVERIEAEDSEIEGCEFIVCKHIGPKASPMGINDYSVQICACNIDIKYNLD